MPSLDDKLIDAASRGDTAGVQAALAVGADACADDECALFLAASNGHALVVRLLLEHGADLQSIIDELNESASDVQVAALSSGNIRDMSASDLARQGICPAALGILLERQGQADLARMIQTTQMLDALTPDARAGLLEELLANHTDTETPHGFWRQQ